jgi:hypothetical protein
MLVEEERLSERDEKRDIEKERERREKRGRKERVEEETFWSARQELVAPGASSLSISAELCDTQQPLESLGRDE